MADDSDSAQASKPERLTETERGAALFGGLLLLGAAALLLVCPPDHDEVISGCKATATEECVQTVSSVPETVTTALIGLGGILLLIALLGIRFTSIKAPGGFGLDTSTTETSKDEAKDAVDKGKAKPVAPRTSAEIFGTEEVDEETAAVQLQAWSLLPPHVRQAAIRRWAASGKTGDPSTQVAQIYAPTAGKNDWYIVFVDDTTFRITVATT